MPAEPSKDPSERPEWLQNLKKVNVFGLLAFSLPMGCGSVKMAPRWPKRAPRGAQEGPERAPREPKSAPRPPQEGPQTPFLSLGGGPELRTPPLLSHGAQDGPKRPLIPPKEPQEGPNVAPKEPQEGPNRAPRRPQEDPKRTPREPQYGSRRPPRTSHNNTSTRLGIVVGWAGGDTRSVKNLQRGPISPAFARRVQHMRHRRATRKYDGFDLAQRRSSGSV